MKYYPYFVSITLVLLTINLLGINYYLFKQSQRVSTSPNAVQLNFDANTARPDGTFANSQEVPLLDLDQKIKTATESLTHSMSALTQLSIAQGKPLPSGLLPTAAPFTKVKEYYIPLGIGATSSTEWVDLPGIEAYIAPGNYGKIVGLYFEATIKVPTSSGQVYARLRNVTDNVSLVESEIATEGSSARLISSGKLPIPASTKLFRVQLRSSLGAGVALDNARLKIFVE